MHSIILYTWCSFSLSYKKIALSVKIQHPANNTWSWAQRQNKDGNYHIQGQRNNQGSQLVCNIIIQIQAFKSEKTKKAKMFI